MWAGAKGNAAEAAVLAAMTECGFNVLLPFGAGQQYDLAVDLGEGIFLRVQCKAGRLVSGCIVFNSRTTDHGRGRLPYAGLADAFGVHFPRDRAVYLVPVAEIPGFAGRLRLKAALNNQKRGVRLASDYEIHRWTMESLRAMASEQGAPAQDRSPSLA